MKNSRIRGMGAAVTTPSVPRPNPYPSHLPLQPHLPYLKALNIVCWEDVVCGYLPLQCEVGMVKYRGHYFRTIVSNDLELWGGKKFKLETCDQNRCHVYNVKRDTF